jgi:hypothetical protein
MHTRRPLSVAADKLGVTAMRCAHLLSTWAAAGSSVDRTGRGTLVEVYPAGALVRWGLNGGGYKGGDGAPLQALVRRVCEALPCLELSEDDRQLCERDDDAFDALVAALVARAAHLGLTNGPPPSLQAQAAEEGWIHLPLHGSLQLLQPSRARVAAPADALATRLRELGVPVTTRGYVERFDDAVLPNLTPHVKAAIRRDLTGKGGSELVERGRSLPKFHAAHSSAGLAANAFAPWLGEHRGIPFQGEQFTGEVHLEAKCQTGLRGTPPTLDCLVDGPHVLAVESKLTDTFATHEALFPSAYGAVVASLAHQTWRHEYDRLAEDPQRYRFLDAAQLVKHYLGLRRQFRHRTVTFAYLYWEPTNASDIAQAVVHAAELEEFTRRVKDPQLRFVGMSYRTLWEDWAGPDRPAWLREHAAALRQRYEVTA